MKKINLMDIMESLSSDNTEDAEAALHEWFVDMARKAAGVSQVDEDDSSQTTYNFKISCASENPLWQHLSSMSPEERAEHLEDGPDWTNADYVILSKDFTAPTLDDAFEAVEDEIDDFTNSDPDEARAALEDLGWEPTNSGSGDFEYGVTIHSVAVGNKVIWPEGEGVQEDRVDELSRDTLKSYAQKARRQRDSHDLDDEKVGRRVAGLDMAIAAGKRDRTKPQYESEGSSTFEVRVDFIWGNKFDDEPGSNNHFEMIIKNFKASSPEEAKAQAQAEIDNWDNGDPQQTKEELVYEAGWDEGSTGYTDRECGYEILSAEPVNENAVEEDRIDELSREKMMAYAKQARKDRDNPTLDDEKVGRRVSGLGMVAKAAKREKSKPQYESEFEPEFVEACHKAREASKEGYVQHVDKLDNGGYKVSDWMSDDTVASYSNGHHIGGEDPLPMEPAESVEEDVSTDDLIAELHEAFKGLETVSDKLQNVEGAQVGEAGKVPVNTKAALPSRKAKDRVGGEAVEVKSDSHKGFDLEKAPKVASTKVKADASTPDVVEVKDDKSALLNKVDGKINTTSPISGKGAKGLK